LRQLDAPDVDNDDDGNGNDDDSDDDDNDGDDDDDNNDDDDGDDDDGDDDDNGDDNDDNGDVYLIKMTWCLADLLTGYIQKHIHIYIYIPVSRLNVSKIFLWGGTSILCRIYNTIHWSGSGQGRSPLGGTMPPMNSIMYMFRYI
jgi:hypothetical protein